MKAAGHIKEVNNGVSEKLASKANFSKFSYFFGVSERFGSCRSCLESLGLIWACEDVFGCARILLDAFGCVRMYFAILKKISRKM